jgi:DNA-binding response OmpR family regulator
MESLDQVKLAGPQGAVLVLEDEPAVRQGCRRALERAGFEVLEVGTGDEALALALGRRARGEALRLVLSDVVLPGRGGPAVVEELRGLYPGLRALFMSGYTDDAVLQRGLSETRMKLIHKPFTPELLVRRVREALA